MKLDLGQYLLINFNKKVVNNNESKYIIDINI